MAQPRSVCPWLKSIRLQRATRNGAGTRGGHPATREDDGRLVEFVARLTPPSGRDTMSKPRIECMWIMRHHDRLPGNRTAVTPPPLYPPPPPPQFLTQQALSGHTEGAAAFVFSIRVAAGCVWRGLSPRSFTGRSNGPASPAPEPSRRILLHFLKGVLKRTGRALSAHCPGRVLLTWDAPRPGYSQAAWPYLPAATLHDSGTSRVASGHHAGLPGTHEVQVILKEPHARAA